MLGGSAELAGWLGSSSSVIAARLLLLLLRGAVRLGNSNAFFRLVSLPNSRLGLKARVSKLARWIKACLPGDGEEPEGKAEITGVVRLGPVLAGTSESDSDWSTSARRLRCCNRFTPVRCINRTNDRPASASSKGGFRRRECIDKG